MNHQILFLPSSGRLPKQLDHFLFLPLLNVGFYFSRSFPTFLLFCNLISLISVNHYIVVLIFKQGFLCGHSPSISSEGLPCLPSRLFIYLLLIIKNSLHVLDNSLLLYVSPLNIFFLQSVCVFSQCHYEEICHLAQILDSVFMMYALPKNTLLCLKLSVFSPMSISWRFTVLHRIFRSIV